MQRRYAEPSTIAAAASEGLFAAYAPRVLPGFFPAIRAYPTEEAALVDDMFRGKVIYPAQGPELRETPFAKVLGRKSVCWVAEGSDGKPHIVIVKKRPVLEVAADARRR